MLTAVAAVQIIRALHGSKGFTQCRNGSPLSNKCESKACNKCLILGTDKTQLKTKDGVQKRIQVSKYSRSEFSHWIDKDKDCKDTRAETLITHNKGKLKFKTSRKCIVLSGLWYDPYSNKIFTQASELDIDHIIPLKCSFDYGANNWIKDKKNEYLQMTQQIQYLCGIN